MAAACNPSCLRVARAEKTKGTVYFLTVNRRIPKIKIETRQIETLMDKRIVVQVCLYRIKGGGTGPYSGVFKPELYNLVICACIHALLQIDSWPRTSRFPLGHYVKTLGPIGDQVCGSHEFDGVAARPEIQR